MFNLDFENPAPQVICHPSLQIYADKILTGLNPFFLRDHIIVFSSGTTSGILKGYALSKAALFYNAQLVNNHFNLSPNDTWALSLPIYHVGGLSILFRANLIKARVIDARGWEPHSWVDRIDEAKVTSLVPTQLYDLVKAGLKAPKNLKYLIIGGDYLNSSLMESALRLGWPVVRSYGMTEVCSQLACAPEIGHQDLHILPGHVVKTHLDRLLIQTKSLFTLEFKLTDHLKIQTLKQLSSSDGFYQTQDRAKIEGHILCPMGRIGEEYKLNGHLINLLDLKERLGQFLMERQIFGEMEFQLKSCERQGKRLILLTKIQDPDLIKKVESLISPLKIDEIDFVQDFSRTELGKLKQK